MQTLLPIQDRIEDDDVVASVVAGGRLARPMK